MTSKKGYSDLITRIRNGYMAKLDCITFLHTSRNINLLRILRNEGLISGWSETISTNSIESNNLKDFQFSKFIEGRVLLKYIDGEPAIREIKTISKQSRRVFISVIEMEDFLKKEGFNRFLILSTNKGLLTHLQAIHQRVGGEVICAIK